MQQKNDFVYLQSHAIQHCFIMKRIFIIVSIIAAALLVSSCFTQKPAVTLAPSHITLKVGETFQLTPGTEGEAPDLDITKVKPVMSSDENVCVMDRYWKITAVGKGSAIVGAAILDDNDKVLYSATTKVTVL